MGVGWMAFRIVMGGQRVSLMVANEEGISLEYGSYYGSIERGERNITFYTICEIAEKLNRDVAFFCQDIPPIKLGK